MEPDRHGQGGTGAVPDMVGWHVDIVIETVLSAANQQTIIIQAKVELWTDGVLLLGGIQRTGPLVWRLGSPEPEVANWRGSIGDASEGVPEYRPFKPHIIVLHGLAHHWTMNCVHQHSVYGQVFLSSRNEGL